jgi:hypothetical protein|tara:strand:+ start:3163 stop:3564 length:402 start_codon:yes stop_codon:yes gene_type:complete
MIDKIFTFVTSNAIGLANKNITKFFETNRNKLFMWSIILFASYAAISTYVLGECVNCNETTNDEITYIPFTSVSSFIKVWLLGILPSIIVYSLVIFGVIFIWTFIKNKVLNIKDNTVNNITKYFGSDSRINKK